MRVTPAKCVRLDRSAGGGGGGGELYGKGSFHIITTHV